MLTAVLGAVVLLKCSKLQVTVADLFVLQLSLDL
jgi:hypothetical protein